MQVYKDLLNHILTKGYSKDETIEYIKLLGEFIGAGWEKILKDFIK